MRAAAVGMALALTSCGTQAGTLASSSVAATQPDGTTAASAGPPGDMLVWRRSGGIAGFDDRVAIAGDGRMDVRSKNQRRTCQMDPPTLVALDGAMSTGLTPVAVSSDPNLADQMHTTVAIRGGPEGDLASPGLGPLEVVLSPVVNAALAGGGQSGVTCGPTGT